MVLGLSLGVKVRVLELSYGVSVKVRVLELS